MVVLHGMEVSETLLFHLLAVCYSNIDNMEGLGYNQGTRVTSPSKKARSFEFHICSTSIIVNRIDLSLAGIIPFWVIASNYLSSCKVLSLQSTYSGQYEQQLFLF